MAALVLPPLRWITVATVLLRLTAYCLSGFVCVLCYLLGTHILLFLSICFFAARGNLRWATFTRHFQELPITSSLGSVWQKIWTYFCFFAVRPSLSRTPYHFFAWQRLAKILDILLLFCCSPAPSTFHFPNPPSSLRWATCRKNSGHTSVFLQFVCPLNLPLFKNFPSPLCPKCQEQDRERPQWSCAR